MEDIGKRTSHRSEVTADSEMDLTEIQQNLLQYIEMDHGNRISEEQAIVPGLRGMKLFGDPLIGIGSAEDRLFQEFKKEGVIGPHYMTPAEWLPGAESVISVFLPFTEEVKQANRANDKNPSPQWLHGRIEGQQFVKKTAGYLKKRIEQSGGRAVVPSQDERFWAEEQPPGVNHCKYGFTSNWSERHTAFVCALGTFGLSRGLITKKGMAGRFFSVITDLKFPSTPRQYQDLYEYCIQCGRCAERCPVRAISPEHGKQHAPCGRYIDFTKKKFFPRYGCGKCQTGVPCESGIPIKQERGKENGAGFNRKSDL